MNKDVNITANRNYTTEVVASFYRILFERANKRQFLPKIINQRSKEVPEIIPHEVKMELNNGNSPGDDGVLDGVIDG